MDSLRGKLLIASPTLADPNFERAVILVTEHSDQGAMGVVLNQPSRTTLDHAAPELLGFSEDETVYFGGPVRTDGLVLLAEFSDPRAAAWLIAADIGLVAADAEISELQRTVRRGRVYAGFSGWAPGQLESELEEDSWIVEAPLPAELFPDDPGDLWSDVLARKGGEFALVATMPTDPSMN